MYELIPQGPRMLVPIGCETSRILGSCVEQHICNKWLISTQCCVTNCETEGKLYRARKKRSMRLVVTSNVMQRCIDTTDTNTNLIPIS